MASGEGPNAPVDSNADQDAGLLLLPSTQYVPPVAVPKSSTEEEKGPAVVVTSLSSSSQLAAISSSAPKRETPPEFQFAFPEELKGWDKTVGPWLMENNKYFSGVAASAIVFSGDRVLVLQRAPHDSMPLQWEPPGGGVDPEETILAGCARELWEEAGLLAKRMVRVVPPAVVKEGPEGAAAPARREDRDLGIPFSNRTGEKFYYRFTFEVDVEDAGAVTIDPNEHVDFMWLTEEEVEDCRTADGKAVSFTMSSVRKLVLEAFTLRKTG